jgi:hypothetical protein
MYNWSKGQLPSQLYQALLHDAQCTSLAPAVLQNAAQAAAQPPEHLQHADDCGQQQPKTAALTHDPATDTATASSSCAGSGHHKTRGTNVPQRTPLVHNVS